ncbi:hypothetical protein SAMN05216474_0593 [Lishizhenia tianjinensis]|uniref:Uncharacterized protein n=1 Tax=Lishizhenia tianjinensis TaxID=477690 RepID=A0A1I6Y1Y4_9FLAO|nr:hypothetical protein [Lishizhenia tianjinensis]SFT44241.1 hypothetical protein SAMN05216474_0593 [Lishizhenia tianjinensis]
MISISIEPEVKKEVRILSDELKTLSLKFIGTLYLLFTSAKSFVLEYVESLNDFRWSNIQKWGFVNVLIERAYKFFGLEDAEKRQRIKAKVKRGVKRTFKKVFKMFLFPLVLVFYIISAIFEKKNDNIVKNSYKV